MHDALHDAGLKSTYHTCGGMMYLLDLIAENHTDASETWPLPEWGGTSPIPQWCVKRFRVKSP
jgi:uroporphyrinogen decarboxylase